MRFMSSVSQLLQDPIEAYHKTVSQWPERNDRDDAPCEYILDENWSSGPKQLQILQNPAKPGQSQPKRIKEKSLDFLGFSWLK
jgi:hypothetical protein